MSESEGPLKKQCFDLEAEMRLVLINAIKSGDNDSVKRLLQECISFFNFDFGVVDAAVDSCSKPMIELCVDACFKDVNLLERFRSYWSKRLELLFIVMLEKELFCDVNALLSVGKYKQPLLTCACVDGCEDLVKLLLSSSNTTGTYRYPSLNVNWKSPEFNSTPLMYAVTYNRNGIVKMLLDDPRTNVNERNKRGSSVLFMEINHENFKAVLNHPDIDVNIRTGEYFALGMQTPLHDWKLLLNHPKTNVYSVPAWDVWKKSLIRAPMICVRAAQMHLQMFFPKEIRLMICNMLELWSFVELADQLLSEGKTTLVVKEDRDIFDTSVYLKDFIQNKMGFSPGTILTPSEVNTLLVWSPYYQQGLNHLQMKKFKIEVNRFAKAMECSYEEAVKKLLQ